MNKFSPKKNHIELLRKQTYCEISEQYFHFTNYFVNKQVNYLFNKQINASKNVTSMAS